MHIFRILVFFFKSFTKKNSIYFIVFICLFLVITGAGLFLLFEYNPEKTFEKNVMDSIWWAIVTMTTIGYGDIYPRTLSGRIVAVPLMIFGIGFIGMFIGMLTTNIFSKRMKAMKGLLSYHLKNHIVICGWNQTKVDIIIKEIRQSSGLKSKEIILVNNALQENPYHSTDKVYFVKGSQSDMEVLKRASVENSSQAIVISDASETNPDDTTILTVLLIESLNREVFTCAELLDVKKMDLLSNANCDELVAATDFSAKLLVQSIEDPGLSSLVNELLTHEQGAQIDSYRLGEEFESVPFINVLYQIYEKKGWLVIGIKQGETLLVHPDKEVVVHAGDIAYYIHK